MLSQNIPNRRSIIHVPLAADSLHAATLSTFTTMSSSLRRANTSMAECIAFQDGHEIALFRPNASIRKSAYCTRDANSFVKSSSVLLTFKSILNSSSTRSRALAPARCAAVLSL